MRKISFKEHDKKRKLAKIELLEIRDDLDKKVSSGLRTRDNEKRFLLYKLAKAFFTVIIDLILEPESSIVIFDFLHQQTLIFY